MNKKYLRPYRGYANQNKAVLMGHIINGHPTQNKRLDKTGIKHAYDVIKLFFIKPTNKVHKLTIQFKDQKQIIETNQKGFFKQQINIPENLAVGWHRYDCMIEGIKVGTGYFLKPHDTDLAIISDIDDTYLISHSNNTIKKLFVMLFKNITQRKPFVKTVELYQKFHILKTKADEKNLIINVSSSEWNLFPIIAQFSKFNNFPNAVILLDDLKSGLKELLLSGKGNHNHKQDKIEEVLNFYPNKKFILIGDDTQKDPIIYMNILERFENRIDSIYIRNTGHKKQNQTIKVLKNHPKTTYFKSSSHVLDKINTT